jgi:CelD/BcsL family acetyltransferase involved in cellulose biosynthesis
MTAHFAALVPDHGFDPATQVDADPGLPLPQLPPGIEALFMPSRPVAKPLPRYVLLPNCIRYAPRQYANVYVSFDGSFEEYLNGFSCKSRATLRRKVRRFAQLSGGTIEWREFRGSGEMAEFQKGAREVAAKTFQERLFHGALPGTPEFLEEMKTLADRDDVRGYLLYFKQRAIAYLYFPAENGVLLYSFLGHDPEYNEISPGTVLLYLALESLFQERRFRLLNFGQGGMQQKQQFSTGELYCADIYFLRRNLRNALLVSSHVLTDAVSRGAGGVLAKLRVKRTFKRLLRYGAS